MNVEVGAKASLFPEKEYIIGNAVAVHDSYVDWGDCARLRLAGVAMRRLQWPRMFQFSTFVDFWVHLGTKYRNCWRPLR